MFADCDRDRILAKNLGFKGKYLGTFPGGGGYVMSSYKSQRQLFENREIYFD